MGFECRDKYALALSRATNNNQQVEDERRAEAKICTPMHCLVLPHFRIEIRDDATYPSPRKLHDPGGSKPSPHTVLTMIQEPSHTLSAHRCWPKNELRGNLPY